jgi:hypothetical protein
MKKYLIIAICCFLFIFTLFGCNEDETKITEESRKFNLLLQDHKYEEVRDLAKEMYADEQLLEIMDFIDEIEELNEEQNKKQQKKYEKAFPKTRLEIQKGSNYEIRGDYIYINGSVKNVSISDINYFEVRVDFKDEDDNVLDSNYTNDRLTLKPGDKREFEIMHRWNDDYAKYQLSIDDVK